MGAEPGAGLQIKRAWSRATDQKEPGAGLQIKEARQRLQGVGTPPALLMRSPVRYGDVYLTFPLCFSHSPPLVAVRGRLALEFYGRGAWSRATDQKKSLEPGYRSRAWSRATDQEEPGAGLQINRSKSGEALSSPLAKIEHWLGIDAPEHHRCRAHNEREAREKRDLYALR